MDPVTAAIAAAAAAALRGGVSEAVLAAYERLAALLAARVPQVDLPPVADGPVSYAERAALAERLLVPGPTETPT